VQAVGAARGHEKSPGANGAFLNPRSPGKEVMGNEESSFAPDFVPVVQGNRHYRLVALGKQGVLSP
jgi:hypothetical protein